MPDNRFDLGEPEPDKIRVEAPEPPPVDVEQSKARIAEKVRSDSRAKRLTSEQDVLELTPELQRDELRGVFSGMATEALYGDMRAVVASSGRVYLYSEDHLASDEAADRGVAEEAKLVIVEKIRSDSAAIALTPLSDLEPLIPFDDPAKRTALLDDIQGEDRFRDIRVVSGPEGEVYYHSDRYMSGRYGAIMMRAKANNRTWAIAELVREHSQIMPAPTPVTTFKEAVFEIPPGELDGAVEALLRTAEYSDVKKLVHPKTGAVYLYSDRFLDERAAFAVMDWNEVGALRNP
jgi:hypothetical protein